MRYKARFEKGCFHDGDGNRYRIRAKGVPYDELRANITELIRIFEEELRGSYHNYNDGRRQKEASERIPIN